MGGKDYWKEIVVISFILITTLCGCSSPQVNKTDDITETKTYLYSYDYETETNGEVSTAYHEENHLLIWMNLIEKLNLLSISEVKLVLPLLKWMRLIPREQLNVQF